MRIGIDISPLKTAHQFRGVGFYTQRLIEALKKVDKKNEYILFTKDQRPTTSDLIHYPYFDLFFLTLPIKKPVPVVVTIHDVIPLVFPEHYPKGVKGWLKFQIQKFSLQGVSAVITDSMNSKKDIVKHLGFPKEKIFVIPLAQGEEFEPLAISNQLLAKTRRKYSLPERFILYVGDVNWNKNIPGLIKAFKKLKNSKNQGIKLVLVGKAFEDKSLPETRAILRLIEELGLNNQTKILGFVPTKDLVAIYNLATVYCQPSFYEGFGLPILEAMACGTTVVCSQTSSLPEVVDDAVVFVDPHDYNNIAEGIKKAVEDKKLADSLRKKGFQRGGQFNWERTAKETIKVYRGVIPVPPSRWNF